MKTLLEIIFLAGLNVFLFGSVQRKMAFHLLAMHQQLTVYKRTVKKPKIKERDRIFWMILSRFWTEWKSRLIIVKPETVIRWNRRRFKNYWLKISKPKEKVGRPKITQEHIEFIRRISSENAHSERCLRTLRRECLDHVIIINRRHLKRTLAEFISWYNHGRFIQGIDGIPDPYPELKEEKPKHGKIVSIPVLNGLHHDYRLAA